MGAMFGGQAYRLAKLQISSSMFGTGAKGNMVWGLIMLGALILLGAIGELGVMDWGLG